MPFSSISKPPKTARIATACSPTPQTTPTCRKSKAVTGAAGPGQNVLRISRSSTGLTRAYLSAVPDPLRDICSNAKRPLFRQLSPQRTAQLVHLRAASEGQGQPPSLRAELPGRQVSDGPAPSPKLPPRVRPKDVPGLQLVTEDQDTHGCTAASERSQACGEARGAGGDLVEHRLR